MCPGGSSVCERLQPRTAVISAGGAFGEPPTGGERRQTSSFGSFAHNSEHHDVYDSRGCHCNGKRTLRLTHPLPPVLRVTRLTELEIENFLPFWISVTPVTACSLVDQQAPPNNCPFYITYKERTFLCLNFFTADFFY